MIESPPNQEQTKPFLSSENPTNFTDSRANDEESKLKPCLDLKEKLLSTPDADEIQKFFKFDNLTKLNIFGYGVGHFINDLAAAGWFNYLTIYLKSINPIDETNPGFYAGYFKNHYIKIIQFLKFGITIRSNS